MKKCILFCFIILTTSALQAQTHVWLNNAVDANWFNPVNWSTGTVPTSASTVQIPDGLEVHISGNSASASTLTLLGSAILTINNNLTVLNTLETSLPSQLIFTEGTLEAALIENFGTLQTETAQLKDLKNTVINNHNMFKIVSSNILRLDGTVVINNMEDATIEITANGGFIQQNNASATLNNFGLITKFNTTTAFGSHYMTLNTINSGTIFVDQDNQLLFLSNQSSLTNTSTGVLTGTGVFDITSPFVNEGTISPGGDEIGTLSFINTFATSSSSILQIDIDPVSGENDLIRFVGSGSISGTISIPITQGTPLEIGDQLTIFTAQLGIDSCNLPAQVFSNDGGINDIIFNVLCQQNSLILEVETILLDTPVFETQEIKFDLQSNPVSNQAIFKIDPASVSKNTSIKVYDITGKKIEIVTAISETTILNIQRYTSGIYLAKFESQGISKTLKMIVQH